MIIQNIAGMVGQATPKFKCSKCQDASAEMMWLGLALEVNPRQRWPEGNLYFCKGCAVDVCLGLLHDVAEIEKRHGNATPIEAWQKFSSAFKPGS